ncbi:MAG: filamentous hemagglutinin N-terminal domain-containing protein [Pseudomonadota bacterium]
MNHIHKSIWNESTGAFVAAPENARGPGTRSPGTARPLTAARFAVNALSACLMLSFGASVYALPVNGVVAAGAATISSGGATTTITQSTANVVVNWQSFSIAAGQTVQFVQPGSASVALNRVLGADPSSIMGNLSANGKVFLLNPNGVLFGNGASVSVGGLVATTMSLSDANFMAGNYSFTDAGSGSVVNRGTINAADGGYVALLGKSVSNQGVISARLGSVALAAGNAVTMDVTGDGLLNISVAQGAVNALVENGGMIQADGGRVLLTAQAAGNLLQTAVNNTGLIQAQTIVNRNGTILLLGDMQSGTMSVGGTLDASAPNGGSGGFIETSAAHVNIRDDVRVTTAAPQGQMGSWLIDPQDFIIGAGGNISGVTLSGQLVNNSITIKTAAGNGNGDIFVNDAITWTAAGAPTTLTLNADRDTNINAAVTATNGNFATCCGRDVNVNAALTTTNGSILLSAGRNVNMNAAVTATDGNLMMCAANDVNISAKITLTNGTLDPTRSLGLARGLTLSADTDGTGPGLAGGTVVFGALTPPAAVTNAPVVVNYNPVSYTTPTDYSTKFTLTGGATLSQRMLVFPEAEKYYDGTTNTVFYSLKGNPAGVSLIAGPGATATFDNATPGINKSVSFTGYTLSGPNAAQYALATTCCGPIVQKTTSSIKPGSNFTFGSALAVFAFNQAGMMPTYMSDAGDVFFSLKEEEVPEVTPLPPRLPYVAPKYLPKPARN